MLENMAEETIPNGFPQNPIEGSNNINPPLKKKRNLPGTPGKYFFFICTYIPNLYITIARYIY